MPVYAFGQFILDTAERRLLRDGEPVSVTGKTFQILQMLVEADGRLIEREQFFERLWPNVIVEPRNLTVHISTLRRLLGDGPEPYGYFETVSRVGYRLAVPVRVLPSEAAPGMPANRPLTRPSAVRPSAQPIAVLPFSTNGASEPDSLLGVGMADALSTQLGGLAGLMVRAAPEMDDIVPRHDPVAAGRALGVDHVLSGTVQRHAERLQVSAQLIDVAGGTVRWDERFEQPLTEGAGLQDAIARRVAAALAPPSSSADHEALQSYRSLSTEAYFLQLQARANLSLHARLPALKAMGLFEQALALDPDYAIAHAGLASTFLFLTSTVIRRPLPVDEAVRLARESAQRAIACDENLSEAWTVLGRIKMDYEWDWHGAEADLGHAVALNPNSTEAVAAYGLFASAMGRHAEALDVMERARRLDPRRLETLEHLSVACWMADETDRALAVLKEAMTSAPHAGRAHLGRMFILDQLGRHDEAMADRLAWLRRQTETQGLADRLAALARSSGWRAAMTEWLAMLERTNRWMNAAMQWMALEQPARALDALERGVAERVTYLGFLRQYPSFRPLHDEPRFKHLVRELKLAS